TNKKINDSNFIDIIDRKENMMITKDRLIMILKIEPISIKLMSKADQIEFKKKYSRLLDTLKNDYFQLSTTTTTDMNTYIKNVQESKKETKLEIRKKILNEKLKSASIKSSIDDYVEPLYFIGIEEENTKKGYARIMDHMKKIKTVFNSINAYAKVQKGQKLDEVYQLYLRRNEFSVGISRDQNDIVMDTKI
ncbi:MAG: hypothetical protein ACQEQF_08815, partial [Bacillota bacterium]